MNSTSLIALKKELQGDKGLIKKVRDIYIPKTFKMSTLAQEKVESEEGNFKNIDVVLDKLLVAEYEIYKLKQAEVTSRFIEFIEVEADKKNHPITRSIIDDFKKSVDSGLDPITKLNGIISIVTVLAESNRQSRVTRSGTSLMNHISYLLEKNGFIEDQHFKREIKLYKGCKLDFFFPDAEMYKTEPKNCCAVACQTSSNDRFRLSSAQTPNDTRNRNCTAIGCDNFGKKLGPESLSGSKLNEAKDNGIKFVVLEKALDERLCESNSVMTYNQWFDELKSLKTFW